MFSFLSRSCFCLTRSTSLYTSIIYPAHAPYALLLSFSFPYLVLFISPSFSSSFLVCLFCISQRYRFSVLVSGTEGVESKAGGKKAFAKKGSLFSLFPFGLDGRGLNRIWSDEMSGHRLWVYVHVHVHVHLIGYLILPCKVGCVCVWVGIIRYAWPGLAIVSFY